MSDPAKNPDLQRLANKLDRMCWEIIVGGVIVFALIKFLPECG